MNYANKNATKCREHLLERCERIPNAIRHRISNFFVDSPLKTWTQVKIPIWSHFSIINLNEGIKLNLIYHIIIIYFPFVDRKQYKCNYCEKMYSSKNVTKFRLHLLLKCQQIPENARADLNCELSRSFSKGIKPELSSDEFQVLKTETE